MPAAGIWPRRRHGFPAGNVWGLQEGSGHVRGGCPARRTTGGPRGELGWAADFTIVIFTLAIFTTAIALQLQSPPRCYGAELSDISHGFGGAVGAAGSSAMTRERSRSAPAPRHVATALPFPRGRCWPHTGCSGVFWQQGSPAGQRPACHTCTLTRRPWETSWHFQGGGFGGAAAGPT